MPNTMGVGWGVTHWADSAAQFTQPLCLSWKGKWSEVLRTRELCCAPAEPPLCNRCSDSPGYPHLGTLIFLAMIYLSNHVCIPNSISKCQHIREGSFNLRDCVIETVATDFQNPWFLVMVDK